MHATETYYQRRIAELEKARDDERAAIVAWLDGSSQQFTQLSKSPTEGMDVRIVASTSANAIEKMARHIESGAHHGGVA